MENITLHCNQEILDHINYTLSKINNKHIHLSPHDIMCEALAVYKWILDRTDEGYAVVAANKNKQPVSQIVAPHIPLKYPTK